MVDAGQGNRSAVGDPVSTDALTLATVTSDSRDSRKVEFDAEIAQLAQPYRGESRGPIRFCPVAHRGSR